MPGVFHQHHCQKSPQTFPTKKKTLRPKPPMCVTLIITSLPPGKCCAKFYLHTPNMLMVRDHADLRFQKAIVFMKANPTVSLPEAMREMEFSAEEAILRRCKCLSEDA